MSDVIAITGSTGNVGREVVRALLARGAHVRVLEREAAKARTAFGDAVTSARFDFDNPSTFEPALRGATRLFLMRPPHIADVEQRLFPVVDAALNVGVRHIVFLSLQGAESNKVVPHHKVEQYLIKLGAPSTFLRPSFFMQNLSTTHAKDIRERDEVFVPAGHGKTSFVDVRDIGDVAAHVLTEDGHEGKAYELTGPEALTYEEVADHLGMALVRPIRYANPDPVRFYRHMTSRGLPRGYVLVMEALYLVCRLGLAGKVTNEVETLLGRPPIPFAKFARDYAEVWDRPRVPLQPSK